MQCPDFGRWPTVIFTPAMIVQLPKILTRQLCLIGISTPFSLTLIILYRNLKICPRPILLLTVSIIEEEVYKTLISLDSTKATGIDGISPVVLKNCAIALTKPLHYLLVVFFPNGKFTASFPFSKLAIKIVSLTIDPYLYFVLYPRYLNILFMKKSQVKFLITSPHLNLDL